MLGLVCLSPPLEDDWLIVTAIIGLQGFFPLKGQAAVGVGSIECPISERKRLAALSVTYFRSCIEVWPVGVGTCCFSSKEWTCPHCKQTNIALLPYPPTATTNGQDVKESQQLDHTLTTEPCVPLAKTTILDPPSIAVEKSETNLATQTQVLSDSKSSGLHPQSPGSSGNNDTKSTQPITARMNFSDLRSETFVGQRSRRSSHNRGPTNNSSQKPPLILDTAICILLVLLFAIICRRVV